MRFVGNLRLFIYLRKSFIRACGAIADDQICSKDELLTTDYRKQKDALP